MNDIQMHQRELENKLWAMANNLRGTMEAYEFKNYILGMIFYYYLSKREEDYMINLLKDDGISFKEAWDNVEYKEAVIEEALRDLGYIIEPRYLFHNMVAMVEKNNFDIEFLQAAINSIMESTMGADSQEDFENLFDDMQLDSTKLGRTVKDRSAVMGRIIATLADIGIDMQDTKIDVLGNAYEYLIGQFAATAGKKAGEFYTPAGPAELLCRLACDGLTDIKAACDPTCGSGSLLLRLQNYANVRKFYGQELTAQTYNLARMNMILRDVPYRNFHLYNGDTLQEDNFEGMTFRVQVANPPYSAHISNQSKMADDPRFNEYGKLAPASKADFAFVQHMVYHMDEDGRIAVLLPHGVLFRSGAEETIREYMIKKLNVIDAIIGLPSNLFFGTGIPVCVMVLKKNRGANANNILFVDASGLFEEGKTQNILPAEAIDKIVAAYSSRQDIQYFCHVASMDEIDENGLNLNIARYVDQPVIPSNLDIRVITSFSQNALTMLNSCNNKLEQLSKELGFSSVEQLPSDIIDRLFDGRIRFTTDNGDSFPDWKQYRIGDVFSERNERGSEDAELLSVTMTDGVKKRADIDAKDNSSDDKSNYKVVCAGDMVYNSMRMWQGANGISPYDGIVSPAYTVLVPSAQLVNEWVAFSFKTPYMINQFRRYSQGMTSDTWNLKYGQIKDIRITVPCREEQEKIALFCSLLNMELNLGAVCGSELEGIVAKHIKRG